MKPHQHFTCTTAAPTFIFAMKLRQHFICTEAMPTLIFGMKLRQYFICAEAISPFIFATKLRQHFICTEAMSPFIFAMKPRQHFICTEAVSSFIFAMKPHQHFICTVAVSSFIFAMKLHQHLHLYWSIIICLCNEATTTPIFRGNIAQTSRVHSTITRYQEFRDANKTLKMQGVLIKISEMPTKPWSVKKNAAKTLTLHGHALGGEMMQHQLQMLEDGDIVQLLETWCEIAPLRREMMWFKFQNCEVAQPRRETM